MKAWLVALNTYRGLVRSRALLIFGFIVLMTFLGTLGALYFAARLSQAGAAEQSQLLFALFQAGAVAFLLGNKIAHLVLPAAGTKGHIDRAEQSLSANRPFQ